jgi:hypothetical protein
MKKTFLIPLFILLFASTGWCLVISDTAAGSLNGADVGSIDTFLDSTNSLANSNDTTETIWANSVLAPITLDPTTVTFSVKEEENVPYYETDTSNVFAYYLDTPPETEYFLLKNAGYWALFDNLVEMSWAVFDSTDLPPGMNLPSSGFTISHVTRFDAAAPVPEPSTFILLGAGLIGLVVYRRKRN